MNAFLNHDLVCLPSCCIIPRGAHGYLGTDSGFSVKSLFCDEHHPTTEFQMKQRSRPNEGSLTRTVLVIVSATNPKRRRKDSTGYTGLEHLLPLPPS